MITIKAAEITKDVLEDNDFGMPIIIYTITPRIRRMLGQIKFKQLSVNVLLAKALLKIQPEERPMQVEAILNRLSDWAEPLIIMDFEMLFDPRYNIDVLRFLCEKARKTKVVAIWPGKLQENKLSYVESTDPDYHEYDCSTYQVCIVQ